MNATLLFSFAPPLTYLGNETTTNFTQHLPAPQWTITSILGITASLLTFLGNSTILYLFLKNRTLRTPFNVYIINLLLINLSCVFFQYPLQILESRYHSKPGWFFGHVACTLHLYGTWVVEGCTICAHQLIALNRIWAVIRPLSYRQSHSLRFAVTLCLVTWVFVHVTVRVGLALDALYYRAPELTNGCFMNIGAQPAWNLVSQVLVYKTPLIVMILSVPVVCFAKLARRRIKRQEVHRIAPLTSPGPVSPVVFGIMRKKDQRKRGHGTVVLVFLVISVLVFWGPIYVFYFLGMFMPVYKWNRFWEAANIMEMFQMVMDPILFTLALPALRACLKNLLICRSQ